MKNKWFICSYDFNENNEEYEEKINKKILFVVNKSDYNEEQLRKMCSVIEEVNDVYFIGWFGYDELY